MQIRDPGWKQFGSGIRDGKHSDPGSGINIPDPHHCFGSPFFLDQAGSTGISMSLYVFFGCMNEFLDYLLY
jgi:hypothetical protein